MPANVMLIAVLIMAVIGVSYFLIEDKKEEKGQTGQGTV